MSQVNVNDEYEVYLMGMLKYLTPSGIKRKRFNKNFENKLGLRGKDIKDYVINQKNKLSNGEDLLNKEMKWVYLRGYYDINGSLKITFNEILITIRFEYADDLRKMAQWISEYVFVETYRLDILIKGCNVIDFLYKIYQNCNYWNREHYNNAKRLIYDDDSQEPGIRTIKWSKTIDNAPAPQKLRFSDSGFDIHIVKLNKIVKNVYFYDTGLKVQPPPGYYFDLVGRSSISKTGWMLANNIGIIDTSYLGNLIVALVRTDPNAEELPLPYKLVQIIPRKFVGMDLQEVKEDQFIQTERAVKGFGSSDVNLENLKIT